MKTKEKSIITFILALVTVFQLNGQSPEDKPLRDFQLSVFPLVGTDGYQTRDYRYQFSLNMFMGLTGGIQGLEAGGFLNITEGRVEGVQLSGFGNVVRGDLKGLQWAGFINVVTGSTEGIHFSGFMNTIRGDHEGVKGAGFMNVVGGNSRSAAGAGFMNVTRGDFEGVSGAGFMNVTAGSSHGVMGAGFMNVTVGNARGIYGAGFGNFSAGTMQGAQLAGFMNVAGDVQGLQVAGFLNAASKVEGFQLGFINVSDTISGVPIGFLSVTRKGGLRQLELATSDVMYTNLSFKIGVPAFYNIFSVGARPFHDKLYSATGYGIGTRITLSPEVSFLQLEGHSYQIHHDWKWWDDQKTNLLNEFRTLYSHSLHERIQLIGGLVVYNHIYNTPGDNTADDLELTSRSFYESEWKNYTSQWWVGARAGVTFVIR